MKIWQKTKGTPIFRYDLYGLNDIPPIQISRGDEIGYKPEDIKIVGIYVHEKGCIELRLSSGDIDLLELPDEPPLMEIRTFDKDGRVVESDCGCKTLTEMQFVPRRR